MNDPDIPEIHKDENGKLIPPDPSFENDTHKVQYDIECFGPFKWSAFERIGPSYPWKWLGEAETLEGAKTLIGIAPTSIMKTSVEREEAGVVKEKIEL